jgi:hypothetical protein
VAGNQPKPVVRVVRVALTTGKAGQHICMKFNEKLGHSCSETYDMIQKTFGNEAMDLTQIKGRVGGSKRTDVTRECWTFREVFHEQ